jgi:hypothetical protein
MAIPLSAKFDLIVRALALGLVVLGSVGARAADAPIYKCAQENGAVLYTDHPCKGGAVVDVHPGLPDPAAAERLARARAELDRSAARRKADEALAEMRRQEMARLRFEAEAAQSAADPMITYPDVTYGPVYGGYGWQGNRRTHRPDFHRRFESRHQVPGAISKPGAQHRSRVPAVIRRPARPN